MVILLMITLKDYTWKHVHMLGILSLNWGFCRHKYLLFYPVIITAILYLVILVCLLIEKLCIYI